MPRVKTFITLVEPFTGGGIAEGFRQVPESPDFDTMAQAAKWVRENIADGAELYPIRVLGKITQVVKTVRKTIVEPV